MDTFEKNLEKIKKYKLKYLRLKTGKFMMEESSPPQVGDNIRLNEDNIPDEVYRNRRGVIRNIRRGNRYVIDFPDIREVLYLEGREEFYVIDRQNFNEATRQWES